jgi:hypothetical protein
VFRRYGPYTERTNASLVAISFNALHAGKRDEMRWAGEARARRR